MNRFVKDVAKRIPLLKQIERERNELRESLSLLKPILKQVEQERNELREALSLLKQIEQDKNELREALSLLKQVEQERNELRESLSLLKPILKQVEQERNELREALWMPPGHFYSPIPSLSEVRENENNILRVPEKIRSINLNEQGQWRYFEAFKEFYKDIPFKDEKTDELRFFYDNPNYTYSDAICFYAMIRHAKPKRITEIGSGYSSCVALDTNELFFENTISCTFIEPFPELLLSLIKERDKEIVTIIPAKLQEVDLKIFSALLENDILFIDSTHVSKVNSDVNYIFFDILPSLKRGVYIHFHDIFYPFEYPREWIYEGRAWNESYLLRAFLQYNNSFEVVFFNTFLEHFFAEKFIADMPLCMKNPGGSIWLRKL